MAKRKAVTVVQPPVSITAPIHWGPEEKRLVQQIDSVVRDVYRRWGRLGLSDFSVELQRAFGRSVTVDNFESIFRQTADSLSVQFGTPGEVVGPTLEVSKDRLYARVPQVDFVITSPDGREQIARFHSQEGGFALERLSVKDLESPTVVRWDREYNLLATEDKTIFGAILELKNKIEALERRVEELENPPEEEE